MTNTNDITEQVQAFVSVKQTFHINAFDMEQITELVYGKSIEMLESANDTTHEFNIQNKASNCDKKTVDKAVKDGALECWKYSDLLTDLCIKGHIQPGRYFLRMSW